MTRKLAPGHHPTMLCEPTEPGLSAEAWSYGGSRVREVYVMIVRGGRRVVTVKVRVPIPQAKKGAKR